MAKRGFPVSDKPYDGTPPKPGGPLGAPAQTSLEDLMGSSGLAPAPPEGEGAGTSPQELPAPEPLVRLPSEVFEEPSEPTAAFSDDPPEGWGQGEGNVLQEDPVTSQLDPVAEARRSLLEDAARARGAAPAAAAETSRPVAQKGSRVPEIRQALARAATLPDAAKYRSRITVGAAYRYDGKLHVAPDYIDRNWAAWEDGPAISVPDVGIVKAGQWLVIQKVLDDNGAVDFEELKIYDDQVFRSLFMVESDGA